MAQGHIIITTGRHDHLLYIQKDLRGKNNDFAFNRSTAWVVLNSSTFCTFWVLNRRAHDRNLLTLLRKHSKTQHLLLDRLYDTYV